MPKSKLASMFAWLNPVETKITKQSNHWLLEVQRDTMHSVQTYRTEKEAKDAAKLSKEQYI